jgi:hypothetical protein
MLFCFHCKHVWGLQCAIVWSDCCVTFPAGCHVCCLLFQHISFWFRDICYTLLSINGGTWLDLTWLITNHVISTCISGPVLSQLDSCLRNSTLELSTLGCSSTRNNILQVLQWTALNPTPPKGSFNLCQHLKKYILKGK